MAGAQKGGQKPVKWKKGKPGSQKHLPGPGGSKRPKLNKG